LSKSAYEALDNIEKINYSNVLSCEDKEITYLGLSIYGNGTKMLAIFRPKKSLK
jgi:hypothetical protein